jgi:acetylornithine aminotransferase
MKPNELYPLTADRAHGDARAVKNDDRAAPRVASTHEILDGYVDRSWRFLAELQRSNAMEFVIGEARGSHIWNIEGDRRVLDCGNSGGVHSLGHRNPELLAAIRAALERYDAGIWTMPTAQALELQDALSAISPVPEGRAVVTLSSTDSMDLAVMFARRFTGRSKVAAFRHGYHGHGGFAALITGSDSEGVLSYYSLPRSQTGFFPEYDSLEAIRPVLDQDCAAVVLEPINFETFKPASAEFLPELAALCRKSGALLIIDETRTGLSRSGQPTMSARYAIAPDMLILGKGLGGGLYPVSALLASKAVYERCMNEGWGFMSSMAGSPIGLTVAAKVVEIIQRRELLENVARLECLLAERFRALCERYASVLFPAWVLGGMASIGVRGQSAARVVRSELFKRGVLCHSVSEIEPRVVKFMPCLTSGEEVVDELAEALASFAADFSESRIHA